MIMPSRGGKRARPVLSYFSNLVLRSVLEQGEPDVRNNNHANCSELRLAGTKLRPIVPFTNLRPIVPFTDTVVIRDMLCSFA